MTFKIGDRVRLVEEHDTLDPKDVGVGTVAVVINLSNKNAYGVRFDSTTSDRLHDLDGACELGKGWWCPEGKLKKVRAKRAIKKRAKRGAHARRRRS